MKLRADLHIHSEKSYDSKMKLKKIIRVSRRKGLNIIAITDHEKLDVNYINKENNKDILIIKGQEIDTEFGDIIGLFLEKEIESDKFSEVIKEIKKQNGVVVLPHPTRNHILMNKVLKEIDIIEGYNAKSGKKANEMSKKLSIELNKFYCAGSDAHHYYEIGRGVIEFEIKEKNINEIKKALLNGNFKIVKESRPCKILRGLSLLRRVL
jgi:hypothetical protein